MYNPASKYEVCEGFDSACCRKAARKAYDMGVKQGERASSIERNNLKTTIAVIHELLRKPDCGKVRVGLGFAKKIRRLILNNPESVKAIFGYSVYDVMRSFQVQVDEAQVAVLVYYDSEKKKCNVKSVKKQQK